MNSDLGPALSPRTGAGEKWGACEPCSDPRGGSRCSPARTKVFGWSTVSCFQDPAPSDLFIFCYYLFLWLIWQKKKQPETPPPQGIPLHFILEFSYGERWKVPYKIVCQGRGAVCVCTNPLLSLHTFSGWNPWAAALGPETQLWSVPCCVIHWEENMQAKLVNSMEALSPI